MDQLLLLLAPYAPKIVLALVIARGLEAFVDSVVRPAVLKSASKRDDEILERFVDAPLAFLSSALAFFQGRLSSKK
jgi:hypothetical protein